MITSVRIQELHDMFTNVTPGEWMGFGWGALAGTVIWVLVYRTVLVRFIRMLCAALKKEVLGVLAQAVLGAAIVVPNVLLFNLGELHRNFLVAAFALTGILFGLWVLLPEEPS